MNKLLPNSRTEAMRAILEHDNQDGLGKPISIVFTKRRTPKALINHEKRQQIADLLMKYTDPKLPYDGLTAWELAGKIMEIVK